jgi:hypothetical protein
MIWSRPDERVQNESDEQGVPVIRITFGTYLYGGMGGSRLSLQITLAIAAPRMSDGKRTIGCILLSVPDHT